ncbi:MerR family transcriptional regulator [Paenibacillus aurantius]|uniref:MerR family transcriptional regulator n=1 Tax=Paenibacillus aurantius TaxID=2918900 RepID=A0AA96LI00_9BACL|nr:B12-binding domain-containing protein [Paenibacillus aurantius]WNQ13658.1 MerR family transcriptional regulator [Paenibacillus aurantius]
MRRLYTIKEAALRTGLSTQLIRKWEERYEAVIPSRFPNGYRGYTQENIDTLLWLKKKADEGIPIGMAVQEHRLMAERPDPSEIKSSGEAPGEDYVGSLLQSFLNLDAYAAQHLFDRMLSRHHMDYVLLEVLQPVLVELGKRWESGEISEFQEHFGSHFVRDRLLALKNMYRSPVDGPLLVTSCSPNERHELGVLILVYFAAQSGFRIVHLGTSPSEKGIVDCLHRFKPAAFAFSSSSRMLLAEAESFYRELDRLIEENGYPTKVVVGGSVVREDGTMPGTKHVHMLTGDARVAIEKMRNLIRNPALH